MNELLEIEFFRLLTENPSEASNEKIQNTSEQFVEQVERIDPSETDFSVIFRSRIQIYCAIIAYCLEAIVERDLRLDMDTYEMLRILKLNFFSGH
ncbi:MAG: hypothetical protein LBG15_00175 [Dysgonamonadaceae bacterium]|jgi:hypothetical protein|nr:hypothetical protein [Dysgonamonadaceae bacterium]